MSRAAKEAKSQAAADAVGTIADVVKELSVLMDRFFNDHPNIMGKFEEAFPGHSEVHSQIVRQLNRLSDDLAPPDGGKGEE